MLLEKPAARTLEESARLLAASRRSRGSLTVGRVLRYTPFFSALHELPASGRPGDLVSIEHREDAAYWHTAHSFVRGNWARAAESTPMIVQKCCHDFDLPAWNLEAAGDGVRATRMQSFGSRLEFRPVSRDAGNGAGGLRRFPEDRIHRPQGGRPGGDSFEAAPGGRGGGDEGLIEAFLDSLEGAAPAKTSGGSWFESHLPAFSAEEARLSGTVLDLDRRRSKHL